MEVIFLGGGGKGGFRGGRGGFFNFFLKGGWGGGVVNFMSRLLYFW